METLIKIDSLTKDYGNGKGIFDLTLDIKKGQVCGLVGTNGSGKTTTLRHLMGFLKADKGSCSIAGLDCWKDENEIKRFVGYVPGDINFPDVGTGNDFLRLQAEYLHIEDRSYVNELIDIFKLDTSAPLRRMSKGMKQKTALVAAFMGKPDILLLDEPSTGLDPLMRDALIDLIKRHKKEGKTVFMSSHIFKELEDTCDVVAFIDNGKLINVVDRKQYNPNMPKQYEISFAKAEEMQKFSEQTEFGIIHRSTQEPCLKIKVEVNKFNELFKELSQYDIKGIKAIPYSLEWYYMEIVQKGGTI